MSRAGVHNLILLVLVLVVVSVTSLNHYTTRRALDEINDANTAAVHDHAQMIAVSNAQYLAAQAFQIATHEARRSVQFEKQATQYRNLIDGMANTIKGLGAHICQLTDLLEKHGIPVPKSPVPCPAPKDPERLRTKKSSRIIISDVQYHQAIVVTLA